METFIPDSTRAVIEAEAGRVPVLLSSDDEAELLADVPPEHQADVQSLIPEWVAESQVKAEDWKRQMLVRVHALLAPDTLDIPLMGRGVNGNGVAALKPLLTQEEAAKLLGVSLKRFTNILYIEKSKSGSLPDFICDAGGALGRRVITDELLDWVKRTSWRPRRKRSRSR